MLPENDSGNSLEPHIRTYWTLQSLCTRVNRYDEELLDTINQTKAPTNGFVPSVLNNQ